MPNRFLKYSRTEPARTILWAVSVLTFAAQFAAMVLAWPMGIINFVIVAPVCVWGLYSAYKNSMKHMALSSFWLFCMWLWTGLNRLIFVPGMGDLLWVPFLMVAICMAVVYLYLSNQRRLSDELRAAEKRVGGFA